MTSILREDSPALLTRGYGFGAHLWKRARAGARAVPLRLLGRDALLIRGAEAVDLFYDEDRIARHGAMPPLIQESLFGHGSVHSLDGAAHRQRKATFLEVAYDDDQVARLAPLLEREWQTELDDWIYFGGGRSAYDAAVGAFGRASMTWAGLPGTAAAKTRWAARLAQIVDGFGAPYSPEYLLALANRHWSDRHTEHLIDAVRAGTLDAAEGTALHEWAWHTEPDGELIPEWAWRGSQGGELLSANLAGIELQNSIRPMIAVARFVAFAAKELHDHPEWRSRIAAETHERGALTGGPVAIAFAQEIRRTAPFVPMLPGWATVDIEHDGQHLPAGGRVLLDVLGTDTDDKSWDRADKFDPSRFLGIDDYEAVATFIPHGGGDVAAGHRCPGEKLAITGLATAIAALSDPRVSVHGSGLRVNRRRLPTKPASGGKVSPVTAPSGCPVL